MIYELDLMIKKSFRADVCRTIFLPGVEEMTGIFMDGPFNFRELFKVDLKGTLAQTLLENLSCDSVTMPSSLLSIKHYQSLAPPDPLFSVKQEELQALKYLAVRKNATSLFCIIEIGWHCLEQAQLVHENQSYLNKKQTKVAAIAKETINQTYIKLKLMTGGIKQKHSYEVLRQKVRAFLLRWKRLTFLEQFAKPYLTPEDSQIESRHFNSRSGPNDQSFTHIINCTNGPLDVSLELHRSQANKSTAQNKTCFSNAVSPSRPNLAPYKSLQRESKLIA